MADRILRDELLSSTRWLDLATDTARLAFIGFLTIADDFGNFEGGSRRLFRFLHGFTAVKSEAAALELIGALIECDLLRRYEDDGRELFHIPRFRAHRQYMARRFPASPWCSVDAPLGKHKRVVLRGLAKNVVTTSLPRSNDVAEGVGVGVDLGLLGSVVDFKSEVIHSSVGSEPEKLVLEATAPPPVVSIPLNDNTEFPVTQAMVAEFERLYPAVDVPQTLNEIRGWNLSHPKQRKTRRGVLAHINTWLQREQNRG